MIPTTILCRDCRPTTGHSVRPCRLHAAAPALLVALQACLQAMRDMTRNGGRLTSEVALQQSRAAIAAATDDQS